MDLNSVSSLEKGIIHRETEIARVKELLENSEGITHSEVSSLIILLEQDIRFLRKVFGKIANYKLGQDDLFGI